MTYDIKECDTFAHFKSTCAATAGISEDANVSLYSGAKLLDESNWLVHIKWKHIGLYLCSENERFIYHARYFAYIPIFG